jgi:hypothetical protein
VQVSQTTTTGANSPARKDEARGAEAPGAADAAGRRARPSRFREALKRGAADEIASDVAATLGVGGNTLPPTPLRVAPPPTKMATAPAARIDRVLVGTVVGGDAEARIRIGSGVLAGAEISLTAAAGSPAVTAQLLTPGAGSRQTLSVAMEEIRLRLRDKGIALTSSVARGRPADDPHRDGERDRDGGAGGG